MATRLGYPPVERPRSTDLRALQAPIDAARQRFLALEAEVTRLLSAADASTSIAQIEQLQQALVLLQARLTAIELAVGVEDTISIVAAEPVANRDAVVMVGPETCGPADPSDPTRSHAVVGIATAAAAAGQAVTIQRRGLLTVNGAAFDAGRAVYAAIGGGLTQYPTYSDFVIPLGVATSATTMWVSPGDAALQRAGLYAGIFDDFMPLTYGLARDLIPRITVSPTAPPDPEINDLWVDTT